MAAADFAAYRFYFAGTMVDLLQLNRLHVYFDLSPTLTHDHPPHLRNARAACHDRQRVFILAVLFLICAFVSAQGAVGRRLVGLGRDDNGDVDGSHLKASLMICAKVVGLPHRSQNGSMKSP